MSASDQVHGEHKKRKPGWVAELPGREIEFEVDSEFADAAGDATLALSYLQSWEHMGRAAVTCVSGCKCEEAVIDAHDASDRVSIPRVHELLVTAHTRCVFRVRTLFETSSGEHKFKVIQINVRTELKGSVLPLEA
jgi:hypothetical protein